MQSNDRCGDCAEGTGIDLEEGAATEHEAASRAPTVLLALEDTGKQLLLTAVANKGALAEVQHMACIVKAKHDEGAYGVRCAAVQGKHTAMAALAHTG